MFTTTSFTLEFAKEVCSWRYNDEYSIYDFPSWEIVKQDKWSIANLGKREKEFYAVIDETNKLCGFIRLQDHHNYILLGLGLKPSLCGKGHGSELMSLIIELCNNIYSGKKILLVVRSFNKRAIRCYEKAGFKIVEIFNKINPHGEDEFFKMER